MSDVSPIAQPEDRAIRITDAAVLAKLVTTFVENLGYPSIGVPSDVGQPIVLAYAEALFRHLPAQIPCTVAQHVHAVPPGMYVARTTTPSVGGGDGLQMPDLQDPQP